MHGGRNRSDEPAIGRPHLFRCHESSGSAASMIALPDSVPTEVAMAVIALVANVVNRPGFGSSDFDSARISNANCSASART